MKLRLKAVPCDVCKGLGYNYNQYNNDCDSCDSGVIYEVLNGEEFIAAYKSPKPTPKREAVRTQSQLPTISPSPTPPSP